MEKTLVAVFDDQSEAQRALEALVDQGFSSSNARVASAESLGLTADSTRTSRPGQEESLGEKIASFFGFGDHDETYTEAVRRGSYVLTVDAASDEEAERATDIINDYDPVDIDEREAEWRKSGWQGKDTGGESTVPVVEEQMTLGKREIQRGGIRVHTRTAETPVEESINLREEHATVKRRPVDRAVTDSDTAFKEQTFEVRGTAEEALVGKSARVTEEVVIGRESGSRDQTVGGNVRKTEVDVEQLQGNGNGQTRQSRYSGQERRMQSSANYRGEERRAA